MSEIAIRVENLSKQYPSTKLRAGRIGGPQARYKTIRESLTEAAQAPFRLCSGQAHGDAWSRRSCWWMKWMKCWRWGKGAFDRNAWSENRGGTNDERQMGAD
jgi:hypothetical protein